jgi:hypothetical protein
MPLIDKIRDKNFKAHHGPRKDPLWKGPLTDGVTQSMLGDFVACRERFRVKYIEGLQTGEGFNHLLE